MKPIQNVVKFLASLALAMLAVAGCSSSSPLDRQNAAVGAGFKIITPTKPDQLAILKDLPPDKVTPITYGGKLYYVLPDPINHQAYVGGPKQFELYRQFRQKQKMNAENYVATPTQMQVVEVNAMNWGEWGGWGPAGGDPGGPGWY